MPGVPRQSNDLSDAKIYGIGLPRTGTTSLYQALNHHGISTVHFPFGLFTDIHDPIAQQYTGFVDTPIPYLFPQLDRLHPGSKFILTKRSLEHWLQSMHWLRTIGPVIWPRRPEFDEYNAQFFGTPKYDEPRLAEKFRKYHEHVASYFSARPDDLLVLDISGTQDTSELVEFLGLDQPPVPWPRTNSTRRPSVLQKLAYRMEVTGIQSAGHLLRRADSRLRRHTGR